VVGVPVIAPVEGFKLRPGGSDPETIEYVKGAVPPITDSMALYAVPTVALPAPQVPH